MQSRTATRGRVLAAFLASTMLGGGAAAQTPQEGFLWSFLSDGTWVAETVSLGHGGTQVFTDFGGYYNWRMLLSAHDHDPATPVWTHAHSLFNYERLVASAKDADVHVSMRQEFSDASNLWRKAVLTKYTSSSASPDWTYDFPVLIASHPYSSVRISADGETILGAVYDYSNARTEIRRFSPESPMPNGTYLLDTWGPFKGFALSADGSTAVLESDSRLIVCDLDTGTVSFQQQFIGQSGFGAVDVSGDGSTVALGRIGQVLVFGRQAGGGYLQIMHHLLPSDAFCHRLAISRDSTTLALGINYLDDPPVAHVSAIDLNSAEILVDHVMHGAGEFQNLVSSLGISANGERFVVGTWGDQTGTVPELTVFRRGFSQPVKQFSLSGSVRALDLSPDGDRVVVAAKSGHTNVWGGGGGYFLLEARERDFDLRGSPCVGAEVELEHTLRSGSLSRVLLSPSLASPPDSIGGLGTLFLSRPDTTILPGFAVADPQGVARTPFVVPADPALVGSTLYFQGLGLDPRSLSEDWVQMTLLP